MKTLKNSWKQLTIIMSFYLTIKYQCNYRESNAQSWRRTFALQMKKLKESSKKCLKLMRRSRELLTVVIEKHLQLFIKQDSMQWWQLNKCNLDVITLIEAISGNHLASQSVNSQVSNNFMMKTIREALMKTQQRIMKEDVDPIDSWHRIPKTPRLIKLETNNK